jgi:hypothetical protein
MAAAATGPLERPRIFVSIAAYRDPELVPTVDDCLARARHPERLRFGICWQHGPDEPPLPWAGDPRFRIIDVPWQESRGACWARAEVMARYDGEDYFFQLDSHHRFVQDWDEIVIDELGRAPAAKPVLTAYLTPYDPERPDVREHVPMQMNFDRFTEQGIVLCRPGELHDWRTRTRPARARFLSAHFLFAPGAFVREVPYDPELYFTGEEITLAVRAFTHGYDLFHPHRMIAWHEYTRAYRAHKHWTDHDGQAAVDTAWYERDRTSLAKVDAFLANPAPGPLGLGTARTFADYEAFAGLSFAARRAQEYTRAGYEPPNPPADPGWAQRIRSYALDLAIEKSRLPEGVDDYHFWYVGVHDDSGREIVRQDLDREAVRKVLATDAPQAIVHCEFETDRVPSTWTVWPVSDSRGWLERFDGPVVPVHPPVTLVTALVDLGRDTLAASFSRSFEDHYLPRFAQLLQVPLPMVVHVEPALEGFVWRHRHPSNTSLVFVDRAAWDVQHEYRAMQRIRTDAGWLAQAPWLGESPQAGLAHYNPLVFSKLPWLAEAAEANPFGASHLFWVDAGLSHTVAPDLLTAPVLAGRLVEAADAFLWVEFPYPDGHEIHGFPRAAAAGRAGVARLDRVARGGFFGGPRERIAEVAEAFGALAHETLADGLMGTEESLFTILAYREPAKYAHYLVESNGLLGPFFEALVRGDVRRLRSMPAVAPATGDDTGRAAAAGPASAIEVPIDLERGWTTFFGLQMMQNRHAVLAVDRLLRLLDDEGRRPARIVELGTGCGGLSVLFQMYAAAGGGAFVTYDRAVHATEARRLFARLGVDARQRDFDAPFTTAEIARLIQEPGVTLLVCDGPDKVAEVTRFAPYLKTGDLVMAHDYAESRDVFDRTQHGRTWNYCEITEADIAGVVAAHRLDAVCPDVLAPGAWMCKVKRGTEVSAAPALQAAGGRLAVYVLTYNAPDQLASWFASTAANEPALLGDGVLKTRLDNSTDEAAASANAALAAAHGFDYVREHNLGIMGGRVWCARHFDRSPADLMVFFEDDMLWHDRPGLCRNGFPQRVPGLVDSAIAIVQNEPSLDFLKLSYSEFYGDHRMNWAFYNLPPERQADLFPGGPSTRFDAIRSHAGVSYALGEVHYSNWPLVITRRGNARLFLEDPGALRFEQTLMVRALELQRAGTLRGAVLLASPIDHNRHTHYPGGRKES